MSLSDKMIVCKCNVPNCNQSLFYEKDVKEFIKLLKEQCKKDWDKGNFVLADVQDAINKLAGEKLIR